MVDLPRFRPICVLRQSAGRPPFQDGGKSGLHTDTAPDNVRRGRPQGKRHRKQTAGSLAARPSSGKARVKGCGKSAPRGRQRPRHGKPRREQNRIGATRGAFERRKASSVGHAARVGCSRRPATGVPEEWPSRRGDEPRPYRTRLTGRLAFALLLVQTRSKRSPTSPHDAAVQPEKAIMLRADKVVPAGHLVWLSGRHGGAQF